MNWHYVDHGQQAGPVSDEQIAELFQAGKINADTLVWREGLADWIPFRAAKLDTGPLAPPDVARPMAAPASEVVCAECGQLFPANETIRYGSANVCAGCKPVFLQKLSEGAKLNTGELNYAGFGIRFGAKLLDGLILAVPLMIVFFVVMFPIMGQAMRSRGAAPTAGAQFLPFLMQIGFLLVQISYQTFFLGKFGATPGKMACKIKVVMPDGSPIGYGRAAGRALAEMLSGMVCYIGYLLVLFDNPMRRALHDHICSTRVVYK